MKRTIATTNISEMLEDIELAEVDGMYIVRVEQSVYGYEEREFDEYAEASDLYVSAVASAVAGGDALNLVANARTGRRL